MLMGRFGGMGRKLKVVVDAGNGAMSVVAPEVMANLGAARPRDLLGASGPW